MSYREPTFGHDELAELLGRFAGIELAAIFVGAGISTEAGLPSWEQLVHRLLRRVAAETEALRELHGTVNEADVADTFARRTIADLGLLGAAAVAKAHLGVDYPPAVASALYEGNDADTVAPGPTAMAIARHVVRSHHARARERPLVLTTNYDRLLEKAFAAELERLGADPRQVVSLSPHDRLTPPYAVVHLHGMIESGRAGSDAVTGELVLAEDEFYAPGAVALQRRKLAARMLRKGSCLFVGMSLTDPNLLSYLYEAQTAAKTELARTAPEHAAIGVVQQSPGGAEDELEARIARALRETRAARLSQAGVHVAFAETFSDASQFVRELELTRAAAAAGITTPYRDAAWRWQARAAAFEQTALGAGLLPATQDQAATRYLACQQKVRRALAVASGEIKAALDRQPALRARDEQLALHLWVHVPSAHLLTLVAQSERLSYNPATLQTAHASLPTKYLVVEAFANGTVVEATDPALRSSRWGSMIAVPLRLTTTSDDLGIDTSLPVGALVLASTLQGESGLPRLRTRPSERAALIDALARIGADMIRLTLASEPPAATSEPRPLVPVGAHRGRGATDAAGAPRLGTGTHVSGAPPEGDRPLGNFTAVLRALDEVAPEPQ